MLGGALQQQLGALGDEGLVAAPGGRARQDLVVQLAIADLQEALGQDAGGDEELGAAHREGEVGGAVGQVVHAHGRGRLVGAHAAAAAEIGVVVGRGREDRRGDEGEFQRLRRRAGSGGQGAQQQSLEGGGRQAARASGERAAQPRGREKRRRRTRGHARGRSTRRMRVAKSV